MRVNVSTCHENHKKVVVNVAKIDPSAVNGNFPQKTRESHRNWPILPKINVSKYPMKIVRKLQKLAKITKMLQLHRDQYSYPLKSKETREKLTKLATLQQWGEVRINSNILKN